MAWSGDDDRRDVRPRDAGPSLETVGARLWPFVLTVFFGILFAGIADLAWLTAIGTTGPWFTSGISSQVYTATLTTATIATLILASLAANKLALLDGRARAVAAREAGDPGTPTRFPVEPSGSVVLAPSRPPRAEGLDSIISELERYAEGPLVQVRNRAGDPTGVGTSRGGAFPGLPLGHYKMSPGTREARFRRVRTDPLPAQHGPRPVPRLRMAVPRGLDGRRDRAPPCPHPPRCVRRHAPEPDAPAGPDELVRGWLSVAVLPGRSDPGRTGLTRKASKRLPVAFSSSTLLVAIDAPAVQSCARAYL
ncbi:MAG: hypothetical protein E6J99_10395 [Methanobacteriota archaeon]|nr:MAG: hypothetical protein E6J99_10395 [Euryarchaeota archaeon]